MTLGLTMDTIARGGLAQPGFIACLYEKNTSQFNGGHDGDGGCLCRTA
jgi:hypothetical protein